MVSLNAIIMPIARTDISLFPASCKGGFAEKNPSIAGKNRSGANRRARMRLAASASGCDKFVTRIQGNAEDNRGNRCRPSTQARSCAEGTKLSHSLTFWCVLDVSTYFPLSLRKAKIDLTCPPSCGRALCRLTVFRWKGMVS